MVPKERQTRLTSDLRICLAPHVHKHVPTHQKKKLIKVSMKCCRAKQFFVKRRSNVGGEGEII